MNKVKKIWIVDDDPIFQMIFKMMVEKVCPAWIVNQFKNGQEAIDELVTKKEFPDALPNIIFLDINMPVKNGWDLLNELPDIFEVSMLKGIRIYIVSSSINPEDQIKAEAFSLVSGYLVKPVTESVIRSLTF